MIRPSVQTYPESDSGRPVCPNLPDIDCSWFYFCVWSQSFVVFGWIRYFVIDCFQLFHASNLYKTIMVLRLRELYFSWHDCSMSSKIEKPYSDADFKEVKEYF